MRRVLGGLQSLWSMTGPVRGVDAPTHAALPYAEARGRAGRPPVADVYLPDGPGPHPSIVWVHGGGFAVGSRAMKPMRLLSTACRRAGWAVMTFDYRLLLRGGGVEAALHDTTLAMGWWRDQAPRFALDPNRIALGGLSAGGCLALLAAPRLDPQPYKVVSVFSLYDFDSLRGGAGGLLSRLAAGTDPATRQALSPAHGPDLPMPVLLLHGTADTLIPVSDAHRYAQRRQAAGLPTTLRIYEGAPHAFFNWPQRPPAPEATHDLLAWLDAPQAH